MALAFDATKVAFVSGRLSRLYRVHQEQSGERESDRASDIGVSRDAEPGRRLLQHTRVLTFTALANGAANIDFINDDGGTFTGWFDADTFDVIPTSYTQADVCRRRGGSCVVVPVPAAAWLFVSALGGLAALRRRSDLGPSWPDARAAAKNQKPKNVRNRTHT